MNMFEVWIHTVKYTQHLHTARCKCRSFLFYNMLSQSWKAEHLKVIFSPSEKHVFRCQHVSKILTYLLPQSDFVHLDFSQTEDVQKQTLGVNAQYVHKFIA